MLVPQAMKILALSAGMYLITQPAIAGGSLNLTEILPLTHQSSKLQQEIDAVLADKDKTPLDIICAGSRLGKQFAPLDGNRIAPFTCKFSSDKYLHIKAQTFVKLTDGQLVTLSDFEAMTPKPEQPSLQSFLKSWSWQKTEELEE